MIQQTHDLCTSRCQIQPCLGDTYHLRDWSGGAVAFMQDMFLQGRRRRRCASDIPARSSSRPRAHFPAGHRRPVLQPQGGRREDLGSSAGCVEVGGEAERRDGLKAGGGRGVGVYTSTHGMEHVYTYKIHLYVRTYIYIHVLYAYVCRCLYHTSVRIYLHTHIITGVCSDIRYACLCMIIYPYTSLMWFCTYMRKHIYKCVRMHVHEYGSI